MKPKELREKTDEELIKLLQELAKEKIVVSSEHPKKVREIRKNIARIKTILRERGIKL